MDPNLSPEEIREYLKNLIDKSPSINDLDEEEKTLRVNAMLNSDIAKMKEIIKVLEEEQEFMQNMETELEQHSDEVKAYYDEAVEDKHVQDREARKEAESAEQKTVNNEAKNLMEKLEEIESKEKAPKAQVKKFKFADAFKGKLTLMKFVRGTLAAIIGSVLCGLAGILVVFGVVFAMGKYVKLDVVYSVEPLISFNAYWFALIYGALIGLFLIPLLRLMKKKSFFLSIFLGGVIGALLFAISHMILGIEDDILLLQDSNPIHARGYWVGGAFALIIGFLGQLAYRLINLVEFFNLTSKENSIE